MEIMTPIGRIVQGSVWTPQTTDMENRPLTYKDGSPRVQYYIGLAIEKTNPEWPALWQQIQGAAQGFWPQGQIQQATFAWKVMDGDAQNYADKEGFQGHYVLKFTSGFPFKIYNKELNGVLTEETQCKRGDYVRIAGTIATNGNANKPGIFLNIKAVQWWGYGKEIAGMDYTSTFAAATPGMVPQGVSNTPIGGGPGPVVGPPMKLGPMAPPATPPPPAKDFLNPQGPKMTPKAGGCSYQQMIDAGWTHEQLLQHGYIEG